MSGDRLSVKTICKLTGINEHTLRAWERRYQLVEPERLDNGRRVYSLDDLEKLKLINKLLAQGFLIGAVAKQNSEELSQLLRDTSDETATEATPSSHVALEDQILEFLRVGDFHLVHSRLNHAREELGLRPYLFELLPPLRLRCSQKVSEGQLILAAAQALDTILTSQLSRIFYDLNQPDRVVGFKTRVLATSSLLGVSGELPQYIVGSLAAINEFPVFHLGAELEVEALGAAVRAYSVNTVFINLASNTPVNASYLSNFVSSLLDELPPTCELWLLQESVSQVSLSEEHRARMKNFKTYSELDHTLASYR